jgi:SAM-dependent methyltransferase
VSEDLEALDRQYRRQAEWFYGMRADLLRRVGIDRKRRVLQLGCGTGVVTPELVRRSGGEVVAVDVDAGRLELHPERFAGAECAVSRAEALPFPDGSFDLVFTQMLFLWLPDVPAVVREVKRVLVPGCELIIAAEPDFGGRIEYPATAEIGPQMYVALRALGADPEAARKLPQTLACEGFKVDVGVQASLFQPDDLPGAWQEEVQFLESLGGSAPAAAEASFLFMPYFWFLARKSK